MKYVVSDKDGDVWARDISGQVYYDHVWRVDDWDEFVMSEAEGKALQMAVLRACGYEGTRLYPVDDFMALLMVKKMIENG